MKILNIYTKYHQNDKCEKQKVFFREKKGEGAAYRVTSDKENAVFHQLPRVVQYKS
jgi:hypothetical protein